MEFAIFYDRDLGGGGGGGGGPDIHVALIRALINVCTAKCSTLYCIKD